MARYPVRQAVSAGGLVVDSRPDGRWVVLIAYRNAAGQLRWTLPKGGQEDGESIAAAALREVEEETGLKCRAESKLGVIDYWYVWPPKGMRDDPGQKPGPAPPTPGEKPGPAPPTPGEKPGPAPPTPGANAQDSGEAVRYHKFVHYFLMTATGGDTAAHDDEAEDVRWMPLSEALDRLSYDSERDLVATAAAAGRW